MFSKSIYCIAVSCIFYWPVKAQVSLFELLPHKQTGVKFENTIKEDKEKNILLYANYYGGAGVGIGDFNNDGLQDLYFAGNLVPDKLYLNQGNFAFKDFTKQAGILPDEGWSTGVTIADVNNDGLLDIYISKELYDDKPQLRKNKLYINQGNAVFKEMAAEYGVANNKRTRHAVFFDYDKDGFLDLFLLNHPPNPGSFSPYFGTELLKPEYAPTLYKNISGKKFEDVTELAGVGKPGFPNAVSASDFNNDGYTDLYVANDFYIPDFLYINNRDGTFTDVAKDALNHMSYYSMGVDVADIDNDNHLDVFVLDMVAEDNFRLKSNMSGMNPDAFWKVVNNGGHYQYMFNNFHHNNGNGTFSDIAQYTNTAATDWSWSNLIADFDNDGQKDIYITNGLLHDIRNTDADKEVSEYINQKRIDYLKEHPDGGNLNSIFDIIDLKAIQKIMPSQPLENFAFKNMGDLHFEKTADKWGLGQKSFSNGAAYADLDNDGDLDLVVNNINSKAFIYKNNSKNNYLKITLNSKANLPTMGTRVSLYVQNEKQIVETTNVRGIYSTNEIAAFFGVGNYTIIDSVQVIWPNGKRTFLENIKPNQTLTLFYEDAIENTMAKKENQTFFTDVTSSGMLDYQHKENKFDDYAYQILLPHKMSQFGPALAVADLNGDGLDDVFCGAATGLKPALFMQSEDGKFIEKNSELFLNDIENEDTDALFVDIDGDNDLDLYVVSGGNEFAPNDNLYKDRIYLNDGNGNFTKSETNLPAESGSVVVAADYDGDGDMDLFIGTRHVPRDYPSPASSKLLVNQNGNMTDKTDEFANQLTDLGMVTNAIWTDFDGDKDLDLMVVGEWMNITVFSNENNSLVKMEVPAFNNTKGWWYSIDQADFDHDGDMDYVIGNLGLNYKYKTSVQEPFDVYYEDFDNNGSKDIVLGYYNFGKHYPVRGFSCSSQQVPTLKKEFKKYDVFANLEIDEVYGAKKLAKSLHYKVDTFASVFIENLGSGMFKIKKLPYQAQLSVMNDMLIYDINSDDNLDIISVYNLFVSEIETTRNDAGIGTVLLGDGKNNFKSVTLQQSGFFTRGDAKKIKLANGNNQQFILVGNNNGPLQIFKLNTGQFSAGFRPDK